MQYIFGTLRVRVCCVQNSHFLYGRKTVVKSIQNVGTHAHIHVYLRIQIISATISTAAIQITTTALYDQSIGIALVVFTPVMSILEHYTIFCLSFASASATI